MFFRKFSKFFFFEINEKSVTENTPDVSKMGQKVSKLGHTPGSMFLWTNFVFFKKNLTIRCLKYGENLEQKK